MTGQVPRVGIGVIIRHKGKVLLGKRKGSHGEGDWAFPGGHLEFGETIEDCVKREVAEETSLHVKNIHFGAVTNDIFKKEKKHYITIFMVCDYANGKVKTMEPHKCEKWEWFSWETLPSPLFIPFQNLLKQKFHPFL
ncbi:MAG TPA: NUDIX hydrolase [Candidatus Eisenbacteria bacterium]|nr:NUDIX hydrolase [Candidatus Eisenbacteria bacterium]